MSASLANSARQAASTGETRQEAARRPSQARHGKSVLWRTGSLTSDSPALSTDNQKTLPFYGGAS